MTAKQQFASMERGDTMRVDADDALNVWGSYSEDGLGRAGVELDGFRDRHLDTHEMTIEDNNLVIRKK